MTLTEGRINLKARAPIMRTQFPPAHPPTRHPTTQVAPDLLAAACTTHRVVLFDPAGNRVYAGRLLGVPPRILILGDRYFVSERPASFDQTNYVEEQALSVPSASDQFQADNSE